MCEELPEAVLGKYTIELSRLFLIMTTLNVLVEAAKLVEYDKGNDLLATVIRNIFFMRNKHMARDKTHVATWQNLILPFNQTYSYSSLFRWSCGSSEDSYRYFCGNIFRFN